MSYDSWLDEPYNRQERNVECPRCGSDTWTFVYGEDEGHLRGCTDCIKIIDIEDLEDDVPQEECPNCGSTEWDKMYTDERGDALYCSSCVGEYDSEDIIVYLAEQYEDYR